MDISHSSSSKKTNSIWNECRWRLSRWFMGMECLQKKKWWLKGAIQREIGLSPSSRKRSRMKTKGGKELLKWKEKYGKEYTNICDLFLKRQPHHKQCTSKCPLMHWWGMVMKPHMLFTSLQSSCRGNKNSHLWHHHNQKTVFGINALIHTVRRYTPILAPMYKFTIILPLLIF